MTEQDYQIFETYLTGDLTKDELARHQKRIENDDDYKENFELFQSINNHLEKGSATESEINDFKGSVSRISKEYFDSRQKAKLPWLKMAIAASVIVAIGLYFYLGNISKPQYDEIAQIPNLHLTVRGNDNGIYTKAENAFNEKQYADAIEFFNQILEQNEEEQSIKLYRAIAYMELGAETKARDLFEEILQTQSGYAEEALWYAALNELKVKRYSACKVYLSKIKPSASRYEDAKNLLEELD
ncbi:tetratricopeptide repeat protein [Marivirga harenae]|uniref:tetratricopeptide repeat protein n=1 Tax=Marivirga harenae TaxID=2010992 RepID=UPI0026E0B769|nr:tetratricopeptide repeat protein [Marivirga harenae]WKV10897.1 tetratricopeptide repeat protein [Marivirga harenae]